MPRKKEEDLPQIGDFCYLITDSDRRLRQIVGIKIGENGAKYKLACGTKRTWHYIIEMTGEGIERQTIKGFNSNGSPKPQKRIRKNKSDVAS